MVYLIYIYIYIYRERERERGGGSVNHFAMCTRFELFMCVMFATRALIDGTEWKSLALTLQS